MSQTRAIGWVLLMGAALLIIAEVPEALLFPGNEPVREALNPLYVPANVGSAVGAMLLLWALPAMVARRANGLGRLGAAGAFLIVVVAAAFGIFFSTLSAVIYPDLARHEPAALVAEFPAFDAFFLVVVLAWLAGATLLGIALLRTPAAGTRWPGYLLLASAVTTVVGVAIHSAGTRSLLLDVVADLNAFLLFVALGWLGWLLITRGSETKAGAAGREHGHLTPAEPSTET